MAVRADDPAEVAGVTPASNWRSSMPGCAHKKAAELMDAGVTIFRPETCDIDSDVEIGADTVIEPFVQLVGQNENWRRLPYSFLFRHHQLRTRRRRADSPGLHAGRFRGAQPRGTRPLLASASGKRYRRRRARRKLRRDQEDQAGPRLQGQSPHLPRRLPSRREGEYRRRNHHLQLRRHRKSKTIIEDGAFIGSDATLVAPLRIGKGAYVGAASCVTEDVPDDALALARGRQVNKEGWAAKRRAAVKKAAK